MADGGCEVRLYNKNGKLKALIKGVKASEAMEVYNSHKSTIDCLPLIGQAAKKAGGAKKATPKKKAAKKPAAKKKAAKKPAKKAGAKKATKKSDGVDPLFA